MCSTTIFLRRFGPKFFLITFHNGIPMLVTFCILFVLFITLLFVYKFYQNTYISIVYKQSMQYQNSTKTKLFTSLFYYVVLFFVAVMSIVYSFENYYVSIFYPSGRHLPLLVRTKATTISPFTKCIHNRFVKASIVVFSGTTTILGDQTLLTDGP